jgi:hypothetical protein
MRFGTVARESAIVMPPAEIFKLLFAEESARGANVLTLFGFPLE